MKNKIIHGDCIKELKKLDENSVDAVVTDPPYNLTQPDSGFHRGKNSPFKRTARTGGFMGMTWDGTRIAFNIELWQEVLRVLKPGGHLLSFGGSRTYHRMACAIEDAGFEIRDQIMWVYGSGFPKSHNIGKAVMKKIEKREVKEPTTEEGRKWEGFGTALKPAHEPIVLARKPISEKTIAENVLEWGTGGLNIDGCKIPARSKTKLPEGDYGESNFRNKERHADKQPQGRFPANLIHDGSDEVVGGFPNVKGKKPFKKKTSYNFGVGDSNKGQKYESQAGLGETGSASRFFYSAKASKKERNAGCNLFWLDGKIITEEKYKKLEKENEDLPKEKKHRIQKGNIHPTVKPISLMRYLVRLITPPEGTVLDPFMGSGTTGIACIKEGFDFIGIEKEKEYIKIAEARIEHWQKEQDKKLL